MWMYYSSQNFAAVLVAVELDTNVIPGAALKIAQLIHRYMYMVYMYVRVSTAVLCCYKYQYTVPIRC